MQRKIERPSSRMLPGTKARAGRGAAIAAAGGNSSRSSCSIINAAARGEHADVTIAEHLALVIAHRLQLIQKLGELGRAWVAVAAVADPFITAMPPTRRTALGHAIAASDGAAV